MLSVWSVVSARDGSCNRSFVSFRRSSGILGYFSHLTLFIDPRRLEAVIFALTLLEYLQVRKRPLKETKDTDHRDKSALCIPAVSSFLIDYLLIWCETPLPQFVQDILPKMAFPIEVWVGVVVVRLCFSEA